VVTGVVETRHPRHSYVLHTIGAAAGQAAAHSAPHPAVLQFIDAPDIPAGRGGHDRAVRGRAYAHPGIWCRDQRHDVGRSLFPELCGRAQRAARNVWSALRLLAAGGSRRRVGGMLRIAPILGRSVRDEAAVCEAERPRRRSGTSADRAAVDRGALARLSTNGFGYARGYDPGPSVVSFFRLSANQALLLQSDTGSVLHGTRFGNRGYRASLMNHNAAWFGSRCILAWVGAVTAAAEAAAPAATAQPGITLEEIMADPDWIGPAVKDEYWSANGHSVYYSLKRRGSSIVDLHRIDIAGGSDRVVDPKAMSDADGPPVFDGSGKRAAFARNGDIFV